MLLSEGEMFFVLKHDKNVWRMRDLNKATLIFIYSACITEI